MCIFPRDINVYIQQIYHTLAVPIAVTPEGSTRVKTTPLQFPHHLQHPTTRRHPPQAIQELQEYRCSFRVRGGLGGVGLGWVVVGVAGGEAVSHAYPFPLHQDYQLVGGQLVAVT